MLVDSCWPVGVYGVHVVDADAVESAAGGSRTASVFGRYVYVDCPGREQQLLAVDGGVPAALADESSVLVAMYGTDVAIADPAVHPDGVGPSLSVLTGVRARVEPEYRTDGQRTRRFASVTIVATCGSSTVPFGLCQRSRCDGTCRVWKRPKTVRARRRPAGEIAVCSDQTPSSDTTGPGATWQHARIVTVPFTVSQAIVTRAVSGIGDIALSTRD